MKYQSLNNVVYEYISHKIKEGSLHPGDKLNEAQIGEEMNVSRTPVREALIQLAADGFIENKPRCGFRVKGIDEQTAIEIYDIIGLLDGRAAYLAAPYMTEDDLNRMSLLVETMDIAIAKDMFEDYYSMQMEFHGVYMSQCRNRQLVNLIEMTKKRFISKRYAICGNRKMQDVLIQTNQEHRHILELFQNHQWDQLQAYIRDVHWSSENAIFDTL